MLRITKCNDGGVTRFVVEGKLAGQCVCELEKCWLNVLTNESSRNVVVDLTSVTFVDAAGRELLTRLLAEGVRFEAMLLMPKSIIQELEEQQRKLGAGA